MPEIDMPEIDRIKWDARYAVAENAPATPAAPLADITHLLPADGVALDVAGGAGRNAIWLAQRGLEVTVADISAAGLAIAQTRAEAAGVQLNTRVLDVAALPPPTGPWYGVLCVYFINREFIRACAAILKPGGVLVVLHPTASNLLRQAKPPAAFLLDDGELPGLIQNLQTIYYTEGWREDRHEALLVARKDNTTH